MKIGSLRKRLLIAGLTTLVGLPTSRTGAGTMVVRWLK
jgi:hypothetical protein